MAALLMAQTLDFPSYMTSLMLLTPEMECSMRIRVAGEFFAGPARLRLRS